MPLVSPSPCVPAQTILAKRRGRPLVITRTISGSSHSPKESSTGMGLASLFGPGWLKVSILSIHVWLCSPTQTREVTSDHLLACTILPKPSPIQANVGSQANTSQMLSARNALDHPMDAVQKAPPLRKRLSNWLAILLLGKHNSVGFTEPVKWQGLAERSTPSACRAPSEDRLCSCSQTAGRAQKAPSVRGY